MAEYTEEDYEQNQRDYSTSGSWTPAPPKDTETPVASNADGQETAVLSPEQQQRADAVAGTDRQIKTIRDWMDMEEHQPESPEKRAKRERQEKSKRIISAVSDGISALSNLFFTSQYAPNMYNHERGSMSKAVDERIERLKAERERKHDMYMNFALRLGDLENRRAATVRELEAQQEQLKIARERAAREAEQHGWAAALQDDRKREQTAKATKAEQDAITARVKAEGAPAMVQAELETERAHKDSYVASAANSQASAAAHGRSNVAEFSAWDERGREYKFRTKAAAEYFAKQHGTWQEEEKTETTTTETRRNPKSQPQSRTSTKTTSSGHPAKPSQGTMPGVRDDKTMPGTK